MLTQFRSKKSKKEEPVEEEEEESEEDQEYEDDEESENDENDSGEEIEANMEDTEKELGLTDTEVFLAYKEDSDDDGVFHGVVV